MIWKPSKKWWDAYRQLGTTEQLEMMDLPKPIEKPSCKALPKLPTEQDEQFVAAAWLRKNKIPFHHSPNGGYRNPIEAAKFKRLGTRAGFPDIWIPLARRSHHGLYIELKRVSGGRLTDEQKYWRDLSLSEGYAWYEAKGAAHLIEIVNYYLGVTENEPGTSGQKGSERSSGKEIG